MRLRATFYVFLLGLVACSEAPKHATPPATPPPPPPPQTVRFGILPSTNAPLLRETYAPLLAEMSRVLGRTVSLEIPDTYQRLEQQLYAGELEIGQLSAYLYVSGARKRLRAGAETHVLAQERRADETQHRGLFVIPKKSKYKSLEELRGKRVAYVDASSSSGYHYPRLRLVALGFDPDTFFRQTMMAGSHEQVLELVKKGEVDVGCVSTLTTGNAAMQTLDQLRILDETSSIPDDAIVSLGGLSESERQAVQKLLLGAKDNQALAHFMKARGIAAYVEPDVEVYLKKSAEK